MKHQLRFAKSFLVIICLVVFISARVSHAQTQLFFGDGSDGDVVITNFTKLTRDMYYNNLTVYSGQTLDTGGFRIFVLNTLTLVDGARISRDGIDGVAGNPGDALIPGTLGGSGAGGEHSNPGANVDNSLGGAGGGGTGGYANRPAESSGGMGLFRSAFQAISGRSTAGALVNGGGGGGGCSTDSGSGGSGGGVVVIAAGTIVISGTATISANGGSGYLGCGGGGGVVVVITTKAQPVGLSLLAKGGNAGTQYMVGEKGYTGWLSSEAPTTPVEPPPVEPPPVEPPPTTPTISPREQQTLCNSVTLTSSASHGNQWYLNGNAIAGASGKQYVATTPGSYSVIVTTSGGSSGPSAATKVLANPAPRLSYANQTLRQFESVIIKPVIPPTDNTGISSIMLLSATTYSGNIRVDPTSGVVFLPFADPVGTFTIAVRVTDTCGATTDATFQLIVRN